MAYITYLNFCTYALVIILMLTIVWGIIRLSFIGIKALKKKKELNNRYKDSL